MTEDAITTLRARAEVEIPKIKGSRFIGYAAPAADEGEARALVEEVQALHPQARHLCWAYRGVDGIERSSDAGEPRGSAGPPILRKIEGAELHHVAVVVVRYFGGTKLGVGGLIRAYGAAAGAALDAAPRETAKVMARVELRFPMARFGAVSGCLRAHGVNPKDPDFGPEDVSLSVIVERAGPLGGARVDAPGGAVVFDGG